VLDPQGQAVAHGLTGLGFEGVGEVRVGKVVDVELLDQSNSQEALATARDMAARLLANEVVEDFTVEILD
jgi:phosphoribosylformylglycinamidine synthase